MTDTRRLFEEDMREEIALWPCVSVVFEHATKHMVAVVTFRGHSRKNFYPVSSSDRRASLNNLAQLRRVLRDIGAVRLEKEKPARNDRERRHGTTHTHQAPRQIKPGEMATREDRWSGPLAALRQQMVSA